MKRLGTLLPLLTIGLIVVGCATGVEDDPEIAGGKLANTPADGGSTITVPGSNPSTNQDGGVDSGNGNNNNNNGNNNNGGSCGAPNSCGASADLGEISGDTGAGTRSAQGSTSKWFKVNVTEDSHSIFSSEPLSLQAELTSPPGTNYDVYIYVGNTPMAQECVVAKTSGTSTSGIDVATAAWEESKGDDDSRWATIEVRYVSGTCNASAPWTLKVTGNK